MDRKCFDLLCEKIVNAVGEEKLMSEEFLDSLETSHPHKKLKDMHHAHKHSTGGFASGEIRLAITLRLMAGASYLDLGLLHICGYSSTHRIFHHVAENWICNDEIVSIDFCENMTNVDAMKQAAKDFAKNGRNEGIFGRIIGVLGGWLVKIGCPSLKHDNVLNVGSFYCRKGYCALNVQAIVDRNKIIV